ncbi:thioredoxin family protein [Pseudonocardia abyssalis]|uniref:Thioredoxin n=1 Tax=Pseudonocardia abyssalis TaxID=2792008 RepID=A0ABS6V1A7_9PSEU|nr:thioredoxin domain-containing protein [Pseudonocardia abyssalis]MBW0114479.1 thioredoxin fold domain-containing protein [Pseudonocardia abyssalis]MBW0138167.1 thioredoxin fold domain-containing protein [Pseudonocardia abyssalis]
MIVLTDPTFDELVLRSSHPVLVDFTADWCPPCRMIKPVLREIAAELEGRLVVAQLDVDANPLTARAAGVMGMPTLNLYVDGVVVAQVVGARPKAALLRAIEPHLPAPVRAP